MDAAQSVSDSEDKPKYILPEKAKALYTMLRPHLDRFPKAAKKTLRIRIEDSVLNIIRLLVLQNYKRSDGERIEIMHDVLAEINLVSLLMRQAVMFKYISYGNYGNVSGLVRELGTIAGARCRNLNGGGVIEDVCRSVSSYSLAAEPLSGLSFGVERQEGFFLPEGSSRQSVEAS